MSRDKREVFGELLNEVRRSQDATARFDQAVADAMRLNRTDMRCIDALSREGSMTAGQLAEQTGLSSGAMTTALDRLEAAGYARRVRDPGDRRRVVVELTPRVREIDRFYAGHLELSEEIYERYSLAELESLLGFVRNSREFNERAAADLEDQTRGQTAG